MASLNIFGGSITFQNVTLTQGGSTENLLINPRGVINQAGEADGVLAPNQYFRDGWKAGAGGAEVYVDPDGFRLVSGSIVQIVVNTLPLGSVIRANLDVLSGAPTMTLGGDSGAHTIASADHIPLEISGNNCKFTRAVVAEGAELPIYTERSNSDELARCEYHLRVLVNYHAHSFEGGYVWERFGEMVGAPALVLLGGGNISSETFQGVGSSHFLYRTPSSSAVWRGKIILDARL